MLLETTLGYINGDDDGYVRGLYDGRDRRCNKDLSNKIDDAFNRGYSLGNKTGHTVGFSEGNDHGHAVGFAAGINDTGYDIGFANGNGTGFRDGRAIGFADGNHTGFSYGIRVGYEHGKDEGYDAGLAAGRKECKPTYSAQYADRDEKDYDYQRGGITMMTFCIVLSIALIASVLYSIFSYRKRSNDIRRNSNRTEIERHSGVMSNKPHHLYASVASDIDDSIHEIEEEDSSGVHTNIPVDAESSKVRNSGNETERMSPSHACFDFSANLESIIEEDSELEAERNSTIGR